MLCLEKEKKGLTAACKSFVEIWRIYECVSELSASGQDASYDMMKLHVSFYESSIEFYFETSVDDFWKTFSDCIFGLILRCLSTGSLRWEGSCNS